MRTNAEMGGAWPLERLGALLVRSEEQVVLQPDVSYAQVTVRLKGQGVVERCKVLGSEISADRQFVVRTNQFIISRIDARNGASGLVPPELDGAIVTNDFPVFNVNHNRLLPDYLKWLSKTEGFVDFCKRASEGTTNRVRLKEDRFLATTIPLPPLPEQQRTVARIEELAGKIAEAKRLKAETALLTMGFWKSLSRRAREAPFQPRPLAKLVDFLDAQRIPLSKAERRDRQGGYPYYGASGVIDHVDHFLFEEDLLLLSEDGANLINRSTPIAFVATGRYWVNNHAHVLRPLPGVVDVRFLEYALADYDVSEFNFASAQAKLNQRNAQRMRIPVPPLHEQQRIVRELDALKAKFEGLQATQEQTVAEIEALSPSVLDKAFRGEL